ncbi:MAG: nitrilase [Proteobacteria bacterium]|nr:nitrilase [Pseudomonadota bacterium]
MNEQSKTLITNGKSYVWLAPAVVLLFFANGRWIVPAAAWLAPIFLIRFLRTQRAVKGLLIGLLLNTVVVIATWQGMIPVPVPFYYIVTGGIGVATFLPYLIDRLVSAKLKGFGTTLVFPAAFAGFEYINALSNPFGTWGSLAYTQFYHLPLIQMASITGIWGPAFAVTWLAAVVNWSWEADFEWRRIRLGLGIYAGVVVSCLILGGARTSIFPPESTTVRVASVSSSIERLARDEAMDPTLLREKTVEDQARLLDFSRRAARQGARIVFWQESAAPVFEADEPAFLERGSQLARSEGIYLLMSLSVHPPDFPNRLRENKTVAFDPEGERVFEYLKSRPVPGEKVVRGDGRIPVVNTPFGRIASVICFDMDFPGFIRRAGDDIDLMLVPAHDWMEIDPIHTHMAAFRAVENGFSMIRTTAEGLSLAVDYQGRPLKSMDYFTTKEPIMMADVPTQGVATLYSIIGDLFAWLCLAGTLIGIVASRISTPSGKE